MSNFRRVIRQALTVARRDFVATVYTPTFLLFLLSPVFMIGFGLIGGTGAATMTSGPAAHQEVRVIAPASEDAAFHAIDQRLHGIVPSEERIPLRIVEPEADPAAQARAAFAERARTVVAVLYGPLDRPTILYSAQGGRSSRYLAELAEQVLRASRSGGPAPLSSPTRTQISRHEVSSSGHSEAAFFTVFGIFLLTLLLSGQLVGTMMEEKSNKVVEVLAAATPLEAVFLGKILGMFGSAILFTIFWGTLIAQLPLLLPGGFGDAFGEIGPAVGPVWFALLFFAYFAMAYMLLGALFLGVGAQANTPRELQMLSLPITILQMGMFFISTRAASAPDSPVAWFAELFPFSSPYAMAARAANSPALWPHFLAIAYQLCWVAVAITLGAWAFRRGVLKSGGPGLKGLFAKA